MTEQNKDDEVGKVDIDCTNMDAAHWAKAFCEKFPGHDEGLMLAWFASAIMCGWDNAHWEMKESNPQPPQPDSNELVELRRDAERYRWLQTESNRDYVDFNDIWHESADDLDAAIDAALAQSPSKKGGE
jgi:hypothetical protein